jgi:hypothetical protein
MVPHVGKKVVTRGAVFAVVPQVVMLKRIVVEVVQLAIGAIVQ